MRFYLKDLCDAVIGSLDSPSEDFQDSVREVFCKMDEAYKLTGLNDTKRAEKLSLECRHILVVLRLFPIELVLAMNNLYKKTLWGLISIYLDFKMILIEKQTNKEAYFDDVMKDIFRLLGPEDQTCIWSVVVTSHTLNRLEILKLLACRCIEATKDSTYDHEQYIRMIWVLHVFFSQCKKTQAPPEVPAKVLETALQLKQPKGLCKWMCHHFPGFGWKGLTDANVHEALVSEKQPKTFFKQVYQAISKDDTLKYQFQTDTTTNGIREEDSSSQSSESITALKRVDYPIKETEASPKKVQPTDEVESVPVKTPEEQSMEIAGDKINNIDKNSKDSPEKCSKDEKIEDSNNKSESNSKPTKTLGPGRSKPISLSAFLDDDEDTVDMDLIDDTDDGSKQANKENKKSDPVKDDVTSVKKDNFGPKKRGRFVESGDENDSTDAKTKSKRAKPNQNKKEPKIPSDSETDVDGTDETKIKEDKIKHSKTVKRKVNYDSGDSDNTIDGSENTDFVETGRQMNKKSTNSRSHSKKSLQKRIKTDSSVGVKTDDEDKVFAPTTLSYSDDAELQRIIDEYHKGPFAYIFEEFEASKMEKGAEPFIELSPIPPISLDIEKEATLADVLHNNKQRAKEQKQPQRKRKARR